ncbi:MAG TPA: 2-oxoacid:acceptor oxidoreductase subunit alpha [Candidatus Thermoplasmatota archaeon]|nr:2-oxoacid:acceptor oxidoreductase subunit alpha [Candidatus Thermoplasmatota archaeon]
MDRHGVAWLIAGTAGEGLESGGETFARALAALGYRPTTQRDFPSRIRGGDTTFTVRLTADGRLVPPERVDLALAFNGTVLPRIDARMHADGLLLLDEGAAEGFVPKAGYEVQLFPFTALAQKAGLPKAKNMVALGASAALLGVDLETLGHSIREQFGSKGELVAEQNLAAMRAGHHEAAARFGNEPRFATPTPSHAPALFLSGNEAAALGALAAGCRVAAAYPITPASDILEYLTPRLQLLGGTALQMEDELAAVNVLVGAGFSGAKALTATSGPGLSLMTEAIGLAGSAETPCVIVDCQRPGPSTGMPTKHAQEDLWQMVHGGHGEFVRVVLSPVDVADAFHATSEAFRLAERFRCPAFVALDQQASLFKQAVLPFDMAAEAARHEPRGPNPAKPGSNAWAPDYNAYGDSGAEPHRVALPGEAGGRYYSNSTEHSPNGFTTEDPATRVRMVQRRLDRMQAIVAEANTPLVVEGASANDADVLLVAWGSTVEACREASHRLLRKGKKARVVGVRLLWPFPREAFQAAVGERAPIYVVEANAFAQLARLIRSELPLHGRMTSVLQFDGRTIASDAVLAAVQR